VIAMPQTATTSNTQGYLFSAFGFVLLTVGLGVGGRIGILFHLLAIGCFVAAIVLHVRARRQRKQPDTEEK
jgi:Flp pilus assembly protein TadB